MYRKHAGQRVGGPSCSRSTTCKTQTRHPALGGGGGLSGGLDHKLIGGCIFFDNIMILQGLGVGYANTAKKAQNEGVMCRFPIYMGLPGFDLTTSATCFWGFSGGHGMGYMGLAATTLVPMGA